MSDSSDTTGGVVGGDVSSEDRGTHIAISFSSPGGEWGKICQAWADAATERGLLPQGEVVAVPRKPNWAVLFDPRVDEQDAEPG